MTHLYTLVFFGLLVAAGPLAAHNNLLAYALPITGITIDGDLSDWPAELQRYPVIHHMEGDSLQGVADFQGQFRLGYSAAESALYLAVEVQDDILVGQKLEPQKRFSESAQDGWVIYLDENHPAGFQYATKYSREHLSKGHNDQTSEFTGAIRWQTTGYHFEGRFDLSAAADSLKLQPGRILGFDLALWDQDGEGEATKLRWGPEKIWYGRTDYLGDLVLLHSPDNLGTLTGQVVDAGSDTPYSGFGLRAYNRDLSVQLTTDSTGQYRMDLPPGSYWLRPSRNSRVQTFELEAHITAGASTQVDLQITPGPPLLGRPAFAGPGKAQRAGPGRLHWRTIDTGTGLPSNFVSDLVEDDTGHLWISGDGKLSRWNGTSFTTFTQQDGLNAGGVGELFKDTAGDIWIATKGGVTCWDGNTFTSYAHQDSLPDLGISAMGQGPAGHLWIGYWDDPGGLNRWDGNTFTHYSGKEVLPYYSVQSMTTDKAGHLWIGTGYGVARWDGKHFTSYTMDDGLGFGRVYALAVDNAGHLWLGNAGSAGSALSRWDGEEFHHYTTDDGLVSNSIKAMTVDNAGHLWIGHWSHGLNRWDGTRFTTYNVQNGLSHDRINALFVDRAGQLWLGSGGGGLSHWGGSILTTYSTQDGLPTSFVYALAEDRAGRLWIATRQGGITCWDGQQFTTYTMEDGLPDRYNWVNSLAVDATDALWVGAGQGLARWDGERVTTYSPKEIVPHADSESPNMITMAFDHQGHLWIGAKDGLVHWDSKRFHNYTTEEGLPNQWVNALLFDADKHLVIGTNDGLARWDSEHFERLGADDLPAQQINALAQDDSGHLWIGTPEGLSRWDGEHFITYTDKQGLPHNNITSLLVDTNQHLWIGTDSGVARTDGQIFQRLLRSDGLASHKVTALLQDHRGAVWIGTDGGLTQYQALKPIPPTVHLTEIMTDQPRPPVSPFRMPSSQPYLAITFRGSSLKAGPEQLVYRYRLKGHHDDWRQTRATKAAYTDLPEGQYQFEIEAIDPDLTYSKEPTTLDIEVYYQPLTSPLSIDQIQVDDLFASFYTQYNRQALGSVRVNNHAPRPTETTLHFFLPGLMHQPAEQHISLDAGSSQVVPLHAALESSVLEVDTPTPVQAEIGLLFAMADQTLTLEKKRELTLHPRGALTWDNVGKAAAFITSTAPQVQTFARAALLAFEAETQSLGQPGRNLLRALVLFSALKEHGVRYLPDANSPYAHAAAQGKMVDHIQYPAQLLESRTGDCDDLTVLFCSLLENTGIATVLVDYPGHIFLLFDSGITLEESYKLPLERQRYVPLGQNLWIPLEITQIDQSFDQAWQLGADQLAQMTSLELRQRLTRTTDAWQQFPATTHPSDTQVNTPPPPTYEAAFNASYTALYDQIDTYIEQHYRLPLSVDPNNETLRTEFLKVYLALDQHDKAIELALDHLIARRDNKAPIFNQLGNAYFLKGEVKQAVLYFQQAADLLPQDKGIQRNLDRALTTLGKSKSPTALVHQTTRTDSTKGSIQSLNMDHLYWID